MARALQNSLLSAALLKNLAVVVAIAVVSACAGSATQPTSEDLAGEWEKQEQTLPPVNLLLTKDSLGLRARLRLSGTERFGSVMVKGSQLSLQFEGSSEPASAVLQSKSEMQLRLGPDSKTYTLRKRT